MQFNKTFLTVSSVLAVVVFIVMTSMRGVQQQQQQDMKFQNLKVLPKDIPHEALHKVMDDWSHALGVRCNFCHVRNDDTKKMDWASDAKPEKQMAREMYKMTAAINKKYFKAEKDSLGMVKQAGVSCGICHRGNAHPEVKTEDPAVKPQ